VQLGGRTTKVLVEQIGAVDASRLGELSGHLSAEELWGVDDALTTILDLD
jgi:mRNA-degrading endonuclease toxin of MazEF toxin-antitoxin module